MTPDIAELLAQLQGSDWASALRRSRWTYPFVNTAHILGIALLFGAILPLDLRLLGLWRSVDIATLARVLVPCSVTGLLLVATTGLLLFSVQASDYAGNRAFQLKLALLILAVANAVAGQRALAGRTSRARLRLFAFASIALWLGVITSGRMIAYV